MEISPFMKNRWNVLHCKKKFPSFKVRSKFLKVDPY